MIAAHLRSELRNGLSRLSGRCVLYVILLHRDADIPNALPTSWDDKGVARLEDLLFLICNQRHLALQEHDVLIDLVVVLPTPWLALPRAADQVTRVLVLRIPLGNRVSGHKLWLEPRHSSPV